MIAFILALTKTKPMIRFYVLALISVFIFSACTKEPPVTTEPEKPNTEALLSRSFYYPQTLATDSINYTLRSDSILAKASISEQGQLLLSFDVPYPKGNDYVLFTIGKEKIKPGYAGEYAVEHSLPGGYRGDAQVNYRYKKDMYSYVEFYPGNADGNLQLTAYDAGKKLISGTYNFRINSLHDPKVGMNWIETKIEVKGQFVDVPVR
jgi:hypothetical protein